MDELNIILITVILILYILAAILIEKCNISFLHESALAVIFGVLVGLVLFLVSHLHMNHT